MRWLAGLIGLTMLAAPAVASAGDASCVWRALPEDARAQALKNSTEGPDNIFGGIKEEILGEAMVACVALPRSEKAADKVLVTVSVALAAYVMQLDAEASLKKAFNIEPTALERAYGTIEPKRRADLGAKIMAGKTLSQATVDAVMQAIAVAYPAFDPNAPDKDAAGGQVMDYFMARAMREQTEPKF
jgi:hypothetical protein